MANAKAVAVKIEDDAVDGQDCVATTQYLPSQGRRKIHDASSHGYMRLMNR